MPGELPQGLVSTKEVVSGEIERVDRVEAEDVQKLWKVYHSKKAALADNVGHRLENFFWRIWSSGRIRDRITGTQVATQFSDINEGGVIRTTPTPSPRPSLSLGSYYRTARSPTPASASASQAPTSPTDPRKDVATSVTPTPTSPLSAGTKGSSNLKENRRSDPPIRRPPILKKSSSGSTSGSGDKSSKLVTVCPASSSAAKSSSISESEEAVVLDDEATPPRSAIAPSGRTATTRKSVTTRFNEEVAVSIPKPSTSVIRSAKEKIGRSSSGENSQKSGRRNHVVVANTGASKKRPSLGRRKSSQTSSLPGSRTPSYLNLARSPKSPSSGSKHTSRKDQEAPIEKRSRAVSPHPSKDKKPLPLGPPSSEESSDESDEEEGATTRGPSGRSGGRRDSTDDDDDDDEDDDDDDDSDDEVSAKPGNEKPETLKPLVDPNFRSKFIGKTRSAQGSFTNLPSLLRKPAAAGPASASFQAAGMMDKSSTGRGKSREAYTNIVAPLKSSPEAASDDGPRPLPRTTSQLTLLLERERNRSANQEQTGRNPGES
ncbi:hypothetical protein JMJ35_004349 [Cladonia borealis]|uniref:Nitrogen regulatory protein areA GATA-like domain-containing protein n=1 Tax=Cladonia borealis TaxID=184061 RepID=A0AA39R1X6_9LECA|nr:hypothetical protein JMJ35_004349 [Cladonia borealis]